MNIGKKIKLMLAERGITASKFARRIKISPAQLSHIITGRRKLSSTLLGIISREFGISPAVFYEPEGSRSGAPVIRKVPVLSVGAASGVGRMQRGGASLPEGVVSRHVYVDIPDAHVFAMELEDDSMEPHYLAGDMVICSAERELRSGARAVVNLAEAGAICRVYKRREGRVCLVAINPKHEPLYPEKGDINWAYPVVYMIRREKQ